MQTSHDRLSRFSQTDAFLAQPHDEGIHMAASGTRQRNREAILVSTSDDTWFHVWPKKQHCGSRHLLCTAHLQDVLLAFVPKVILCAVIRDV